MFLYLHRINFIYLSIIGLVILFLGCSKTYKQNTIKNDSYIVNSYKIINPATVPNMTEIRVIKLFETYTNEQLIVKCIPADSAYMEFLTTNTILNFSAVGLK